MHRIQVKISIIIEILKSSFLSLVPYYLLYSFILLLVQLVEYFGINIPYLSMENLYDLVKLTLGLFPLIINLSVSYHLATLYYTTINRPLTIILSFIIYLSVDMFKNSIHMDSYIFPQSYILALIVPLVTFYILSKLMLLRKNFQKKVNTSFSRTTANSITYILPFILTFFIAVFTLLIISKSLDLGSNIKIVEEGSEFTLLFIRNLVSELIWFIGIHGINFFDAIIDISLLNNHIQANLVYQQFYNYFVVVGGSGAGLSLVLAILLASKDKHVTLVGKLSLPFVLFNINEILIFGIPIFMNFSLLIPFLLVPMINFVLAYLLLEYTTLIVFSDTFIHWITPPIINIYFGTDGNILAVLFQIFLIALGTLIYIPFIKRYSRLQSSSDTLEKIADKLEVSLDYDSKKDIKFQEAQSFLVKSHFRVNEIIDSITHNNLVIQYQPKVNIKDGTCVDFEALLRIKDKKGVLKEPSFLEDIENSGLASIIDIWVCKEVKKDLNSWKKENFYPNISINIFPNTLEYKNYITQMIGLLKNTRTTFEIIERRSALNNDIIKNVSFLRENSFKISLDDLGVGHTNFAVLYELPLDSVKIDKRIVGFASTKKGQILFKYICEMCANMNLNITVEGIETKDELLRLDDKHIKYVQGWYFSKALPFKKVKTFSQKFNLDNF